MNISFPHNSRNIFFVLLILGLSIYANTMLGEFVSDDYIHIANNFAMRDIAKLDNLWQTFNTRFLVGLSFALNYCLGGLNTFGYHLVNILLHSRWFLYTYLVAADGLSIKSPECC